MRERILIIAEAYAPGFKAGGPVRSLTNLVDWLGDEFDFRVYTRDRDLGDQQAYAGITADAWVSVGAARVCYVSPARFTAGLIKAVGEVKPRLVYLNSFLAASSRRLLWHRRLGGGAVGPVLLAPRGEFQAGALAQKSWKKSGYLALVRAAGLVRGVHFHATAPSEVDDVRRLFGPSAPVAVARNFGLRRAPSGVSPAPKQSGAVRLAFCSRVVPKKNLAFLLEVLPEISGRVEVTAYGPVEDATYAREVEQRAARLPPGMSFAWGGALTPEQLPAALSPHHFFVLPTLGENHGHAIVDAWAAGLPVLLSDRTPWRGLAAGGTGWDLALEDRAAWTEALRCCVAMTDAGYQKMRGAARAKAAELLAVPPLDEWRRLFAWAGN